MAAYPPGPSRLFQLPDLAGGQAPGDLAYLIDVSVGTNAGDASDRKSTLDDLFAEITKNITDVSVQFGDGVGATVSAAGKGKLRYNNTVGSFQVSENGAAYQNLLKGSGVATRVAFWSATDELSSNSDFYWDNTNKRLGIGVGSTPDAPIDVLADGTALAQQWRQNAGPLRVQMILDNVPEASLGTSTNHTFHLLTNNLQRVTIENGGLVGINKAAAVQAQLEIVAQDATTEGLIVHSATSPTANIVEFWNDASIRYTFSPSGTLTLGLASTATGQLTFAVSGSANTQTLCAGDTPAASNTYKWPSADPTSGQALTASAPVAGVVTMSWTTVGGGTPGSPVNSVQFNDAGVFAGDSALLWDKTNDRLLLGVSLVNGAAPIDVLADATAVAQQWRPNTGTMRAQMILDTGPETFFGTVTAHNLHLMTNSVARLSIEDTSGNVGINKAAAIAAQLHVVANSATTKGLIVANATSTSANIAEFYNDAALRFTFDNTGILTLGTTGTPGATGQLTMAVAGQTFTQTLRAGDTPAASNTYKWPSANPTAGQALTASAPVAGVVTLSWTTVGGATINATDTLIPYRSSSSAFADSQLIRLSSAITELRNISTGTTAQTFNIYGTAANNTASAPTEYVRANHSASSTAIAMTAEIATPSTTAVAGINVNITASAAVAGASVAGAAAGGSVTITAGNAARLTSGNADGGAITLTGGAGIGTGVSGQVSITRNGTAARPSLIFGTAGDNYGLYRGGNAGNAILVALNGQAEFNLFDANSGFIGIQTSRQYQWGTPSAGTGDTGLARPAAAVIRTTNGGTGIGSLLIAPSTASVTGNFTVLPDNAATNSIVTVARLGVNSTGTAADGFGAALSWSAETSTTNDTETARNNVFWTTATHASRTSAASWSLVNNATLAEVMRLTTPSATVGSPFVLNIHDGTNPNVWTSGSFAAKLYLISPTLPAVGVAAHFSATAADAPQWQMLRGRGTNASPTAVQASDSLGNIEWWGHTNTSTNNVVAGARIRVSATENWSAGSNGCQMIFFVSNNAATLTERMSLAQTGTLRIGATSGSFSTDNKLQVGNYASWNTDAVAAIYTEADDNKGLEIIGTAAQTADLFRCYLDSVTPDKLTLSAAGKLTTHWLNWNGEARVSTQFDKTSDTTLANVTGLSITVIAGRTYSFKAVLYTTSNVAGGVKAAIGGTATATAIRYEALTFDSSTLAAQTRATALGTAVGAATTVTAAQIVITGTITVNAGGTLTVQFAQNVSNAAASSVLTGSVFIADDVP